MPELPEVETVARQLHSLLAGATVTRGEVFDRRLGVDTLLADANGRPIENVRRVGKFVALDFARRPESTRTLLVHLRMSGRLLVTAPGEPMPDRWVRATLVTDTGHRLDFVDPRRFGTFDWTNDPESFVGGLDPTTVAFTLDRLIELVGDSSQPAKLWLLRQDKLVGIGNIYASEILFDAGVDPRTPMGRLSKPRLAKVHASTVKILAAAIEACGTTFSDFQDAHGLTGSYQTFLKVYARDGEPCRVCATPVRRLVQGQRSTFFCAKCQRR
jgi:formamidopyrimidine-DNA glycosylase